MKTLIALTVLLWAALAVASTPVELYYFWAVGCPDCVVMSAFLDELADEVPELELVKFEVGDSPGNWQMMTELARGYGAEAVYVPMVFVGERAATGAGRVVEGLIREEVARCVEVGCPSPSMWLPEDRGPSLSPVGSRIIAAAMIALIVLWFGMTSR